ncbi:MAG: helix-turn-helix transcriptional regulator [Lactobacillus crispatus]|nr:helix-turn-helix transcriptional regulator [Lactobacillus crispatus]
MNDQELLARKIVSIRNSQDMSQLELAQKANIERTALNKIEKGTRKISSDELKRIALALHQSSDDLLNINNHVKTTNTVTESLNNDLNRMIDNARFFDGKPIDDHDKDLVRGILKRIYNEK